MATEEQRAASKGVMDAVTALNKALDTARNGRYVVETIEKRETVLP